MSETILDAVAEIVSGLFSIISGLVTIVCSLLAGAFALIDNAINNSPQPSDCEKTRTEIVERYVERHRSAEAQDFHEQMLSMTRQKPGISFHMLRPEMDSAISVVVSAYHTAMNDDEFKPLITSANDYEGHAQKSAHYVGAALDFRIKDMGNIQQRKELAQTVRKDLGDRYTVLHEDIGRNNEHLHVQLRSGTYNRKELWK